MDDQSQQNQDDSQVVQPQDDVSTQSSEARSRPAKPDPAPRDSAGPVTPVSGPHKEVAPLSGATSEYLAPTEAKPELPKEVEAAGVEHAPEEKPDIPSEAAQLGLTHAKETVSHPTEPTGVVSFPGVSQQQAVVMKKKNSVRDAARWLAVFVLRQFDKIAYQRLPTK